MTLFMANVAKGGVWGWLEAGQTQSGGQGTSGREPRVESASFSDYARITVGFTDSLPGDQGWLDTGSWAVMNGTRNKTGHRDLLGM
ncbi:hypothetical protein JZ751_001695 [Albula glossodonta]|uniref:Uncharacterized protein n=1 Tax=Albula glossodonta TaxID=121402 RepID=A0A8T2PU38_9TELE|nr:hypothetical protein JZ751_001695 [Albula glossodonta]